MLMAFSRPRRFGKSLLVNTLKEIFLGNRDLFKDTWIYDRIEWENHPVIQIDFSKMIYIEVGLEKAINIQLDKIADSYNVALSTQTNKAKFEELIQTLYEKHGSVVVLVDEYDKPIIDYIDDLDQADKNRDILKNFYSCLKSMDKYLKFLFITGVSKFSKVSIFSDLNHLEDITIDENYSTMFGYTIEEIEACFDDYLVLLAEKFNFKRDVLISRMKGMYNGYSWDGINFLYNPFSIQSFFKARQFKNFWFATGTATFLVKAIKDANKDPEKVGSIEVRESFFDKFELRNMDLISLLFQTGYLTIKRYDSLKRRYLLAYPNDEVEEAFLNNLLELYCHKKESEMGEIIIDIQDSVDDGDPELFIDAFKRLFSGIPYEDYMHEAEGVFRSNIYVTLKILGVTVAVEVHTNKGRIDAVIESDKFVFIAEFKIGSAEDAMKQVHDKKYYEKYRSSDKKIYLLGIGFDKKERNITEHLIEHI